MQRLGRHRQHRTASGTDGDAVAERVDDSVATSVGIPIDGADRDTGPDRVTGSDREAVRDPDAQAVGDADGPPDRNPQPIAHPVRRARGLRFGLQLL